MNFDTLLNKHLVERPDHIAFYDVRSGLSYRQLDAEASRVARRLHARGARSGDRLAIWLPNCTAWLVIFLACARLGVTVVALNTRFRSHEVGDILQRGKCRWLAVWPGFKGIPFQDILAAVNAECLRSLEGILVCGDPLAGDDTCAGVPSFSFEGVADARPLELPVVDPHTDALVYTTSGTTAVSKLVVHSQGGLIAHGHDVASAFGIDGASSVLLGAPLCGAFGFSTALGALSAGAALVSSPVFDAAETALQIHDCKVTHTFANNELIDRLLATAADTIPAFPSMRVAGFASFAPSLETLPQRADAAGLTLVGLYGSSELQALVAGQAICAPLAQRRKPGGRLVSPAGKVRARDPESGRLLGHGEVGEIEIRAPSLMKMYLDDPEATAKAVDAEGYFRTGDLGITLSDHEFEFFARKGDYMRLSGFLVNPVEIEQFVEQFNGVLACQVVAADDSRGSQVAVAFVRTHSAANIDEQALIEYCRSQLARFKVPAKVLFVYQFPVVESANSNKIQRSKLQEMARIALADESVRRS